VLPALVVLLTTTGIVATGRRAAPRG